MLPLQRHHNGTCLLLGKKKDKNRTTRYFEYFFVILSRVRLNEFTENDKKLHGYLAQVSQSITLFDSISFLFSVNK